MKKTFILILAAIVLTATMIILPVAVSAKEEAGDPVAVSDVAGFAAMASGGTYYLTADITVSETHLTAFSGTFDGKGHKITTSVTLFDTFEGTAKDFTIEGSVTSNADRAGAFCNTVVGDTTLSGIINKASVTGSMSATAKSDDLGVTGVYGGIIGTTLKSISVTIESCENYGKISGYDAGGIAGKTHCKLTVKNCKNFGDIDSFDVGAGIIGWTWDDYTVEGCVNGSKTVSPKIVNADDCAGGIVAYVSGNTTGTIKNCVNYGKISIDPNAEKKSAGGIMGRPGAKGTHNYEGCENYGPVEAWFAGGITGKDQGAVNFLRCMNYADINATRHGAGIIAELDNDEVSDPSTITYCGNYGSIKATKDTAGGIISYANGSAARTLTIKGCINDGDVTGGCESSGIHGYMNNTTASTVNACINTGLITTTDTGETPVALYFFKSGDATAENNKNNFYLAGCAQGEARLGSGVVEFNPTSGTAFEYGEVCYKLNQALGEEVFFQTIGTDRIPTFDSSSKKVVFENGEYKNPAPVNPGGQDPAPGGQTPPTGDGFVFTAAIALVALLAAGAVLVYRRRTACGR